MQVPGDNNEFSNNDAGADYYFNSDGLVTFTAQYLLNRGYCCGNGCLNCPYDYKAVPEPKRSQLLAKRMEQEKKTD